MALRNSSGRYPPLAIACFAFILFVIAAAIIIALIPVYLPSKLLTVNDLNGTLDIIRYKKHICVFSF
jgi:hypothetical protein